MRKLLLTIGSISSIVTPIAAVVSCGKTKTTDQTNVGAEDKKLYDRFIFRGKQYKTEAEAKAAVDSETGSMKVYHLKDDSQLFDNKYSALYKYAVHHSDEITPISIHRNLQLEQNGIVDLNNVDQATEAHLYYKAALKTREGQEGRDVLFKNKQELMANVGKLYKLHAHRATYSNNFSSGISDFGVQSRHLVSHNVGVHFFNDYISHEINNNYLTFKYFPDQATAQDSTPNGVKTYQEAHPEIAFGSITRKIGVNGRPENYSGFDTVDSFENNKTYIIDGKKLTHTETKLWNKVSELKSGFYSNTNWNLVGGVGRDINYIAEEIISRKAGYQDRSFAKVGSEVIGLKADGQIHWLSRVGQPLASKKELINLLNKAAFGDVAYLANYSSEYFVFHNQRDILHQANNSQFLDSNLFDAKEYKIYRTEKGELTTDKNKAYSGWWEKGKVNTEQLVYPIISKENDEVIGTVTVNSKEYGTNAKTTGFEDPKLEWITQSIKTRNRLVEESHDDNMKEWHMYADLLVTTHDISSIPSAGLEEQKSVWAIDKFTAQYRVAYVYDNKCYYNYGDAISDVIKDIPAEQLVEQADPDNRIAVGFSPFINKQDAYDTLIYHAHLPASQLEEE